MTADSENEKVGSAEPLAGAPVRRRSTYLAHEVVYVAVGASSAFDLMRFPPDGSIPFELELQLGSGSNRFVTASSLLMTWHAQRGAGIEVVDIVEGDGGQYSGVAFDDQGTPQPSEEADVHYSPSGDPFLTAGTVATFRRAGRHVERRIRVVYTIGEPRRLGFAWGNADDAGVVGERVLAVEHRDDGTVWATARGFLWPKPMALRGRKGKTGIRSAVKEARQMLESLAPGRTTKSRPVNEPEV